MAFYRQIGPGRFASSELTRGPWDGASQHAGPPAALLGRAVEHTARGLGREDLRVVRVTFDIAKPVPIAELGVTASVARRSRSVAVIEAAIEPYMRCTAMLIRQAENSVPSILDSSLKLGDAVADPFAFTGFDVGYHTAMEVRFAEGSSRRPGPAIAWFRPRHPLVEGEEFSPLGRVLIAADSGNGVSSVLDLSEHVFVNTDLTVNLVRYPIGEWVCLQASTSIDPAGIGMAESALHDEQGRIGRATQSLFVSPRRPLS